MRIKSVRLTNYKRFASLTLTNILESTRLVVLLGPNGCGKSSVFGGIFKKCVNSQAVYPLSEQHGLEAQERR